MDRYLKCPKCKQYSGDSWVQCNNKCPLIISPHFDNETHEKYGDLIELTKEEYEKEFCYQ